jgi:hypothetical protein
MDLYVTSLLLGVVGLGAMAVAGLGAHGGGHGHGPAGHGGHAGHGHGGGLHLGHGHGGNGHAGHGHAVSPHPTATAKIDLLRSPRLLFSLALGFGVTGVLVRPVLGGVLVPVVAALGAVAFEWLLVSPLWKFSMRFASNPATTLDSAVSDEATAVTAFDNNGEGIVSLEVDGQIVQILARLQPNDRLLGTRVRVGQRVRIEEVNTRKNTCTVSIV